MKLRPIAAAVAALALATGALAQTQEIRLGRAVEGQLGPDSPKADDNTPYELYTYRGKAGDRVRVRMDAAGFDAYLAVGTVAAPTCSGDCRINDDGGGGTNALLTYTIPASGMIQIRANSIGADDAGPYTLSVEAAPAAGRPGLRPLRMGQPGTGRLDDSSPRSEDDDSPYDIWTVKGRAGQSLRLSLDSTEFDPVVAFGSWRDGQFTESARDDDSGAGMNARLTISLDARGEGAVKVMALGAEAAGAYTVQLGEPPTPRPIRAQKLAPGQSLRGSLDDEDPFTPEDEIRFDVYSIEGRPGQRVVVRLESDAFDPVLRWGQFDGETFHMDASDDDGGGGTSSRLTVTLDEDGAGRIVATALDSGGGGYLISAVGAARIARED